MVQVTELGYMGLGVKASTTEGLRNEDPRP